MVCSPPPPAKLVRFEDDSWPEFPQRRWSFSHIRELMPTRVVARSRGALAELPRAERTDLDALTFRPMGRDGTMTWAQSLDANYTDSILILHRGRIVYERYFGVAAPDRQHIAFSVTKSFVATLAATLIDEGVLDEGSTVAKYLPELAKSGIGDATIRQLLDMTTGLSYTEDYNDPKSPVWELTRAGGFRVRSPGYSGPESFFDYFGTLTKVRVHGEVFASKTVNTDVLGTVLRRVTGNPLSDLLSERIFARFATRRREHSARRQSRAVCARGLRDAAWLELSRHVVGLSQCPRRPYGPWNPWPGDLHRSGGRDGHRALRLASARRQRQSRSDVAAGVRGRRCATHGATLARARDVRRIASVS
jgi:hypothetical protein